MSGTVGGTSRLLHLLVLLAVAGPGIGVLLLLAVVVAADPESIAVLGVFFAAPIWLAGLLAAYELVRLLRGGSVTFRRALAWAVGVLAVGAVLGYYTGFFRIGLSQLASLDPAAWLVLGWMLAGTVSLMSLYVGRRRAAPGPA